MLRIWIGYKYVRVRMRFLRVNRAPWGRGNSEERGGRRQYPVCPALYAGLLQLASSSSPFPPSFLPSFGAPVLIACGHGRAEGASDLVREENGSGGHDFQPDNVRDGRSVGRDTDYRKSQGNPQKPGGRTTQ